jgi:Organic Anion Transporter Polypeptide (OATP) family
MIGPTFGYLLASFALGKFIKTDSTPLISNDDVRWIGAWWLGNNIIKYSSRLFIKVLLLGWGPMGAICLVLALCMAMFPKTLPRTAQRNLKSGSAERESFLEQKDESKISIKGTNN